MRSDLPTGTVTLLFSDVEGSTRLLDELGADAYGMLLAEHHRACRAAWARYDGVEIDTAGDAFFVAFARPSDALAAAAAAQEALGSLGLRVRMGVHTGEVAVGETGYVGIEVHRAARLAAVGHGGQVLVSAATAALVDRPMSDLGEHRLKDLRAAERVFQLGEGEFPRLNSLYRSNLPTPATPFLGREQELAAVTTMLAEPAVRLMSLTGPGGTGKTRLALQAAAAASDSFPDGVFWVPLAPLRDPDLVLSETAAGVGVREGEGGWALDELTKGLAGKRLLVLYDNVEHLLPEAAGHVGGLVAACPTVTVVVTTRERLALPGERVFAVPPMSESDGEALFRRRAAEAGAELEESAEVRTLCAHLDNLPLALELAAARMLVFSPAQLLNRLAHRLDLLRGGRGTDSRQETLRATIAWSHDLLELDEQQLLRRLSVFAGGCSFDSAEHVARAEPDTLQSLLDKSLLRRRDGPGGPRFWMLETIREFAAEQLAAADETADLQRRHLDHYAAIAKACYDETWGGKDDIERLVAERDNIALALDVALETNPERALELAAPITPDWIKRGEYREGRQKLAEVLAKAPDTPTLSRVSALLASCILADQQMDMEAVRALARNALDMSRTLGYRLGEGHALARLGVVAWRQGRLDDAKRLLEDAVDVLDTPGGEPSQELALAGIASVLADLGDLREALAIQREVVARVRRERSDASLAFHLNNFGFLEGLAGQTEQARRSIEESVALARQVGRKRSLSASLHSLGFVLQVPAPTDALAAFSESLELAREIDSPAQIASCLEGAAAIFAHCGDPAHAASLLGAASIVHTRTGDARSAAEKAEGVATMSRCRQALSVEAFANAWEKGAAFDADDAAGWALEVWSNRSCLNRSVTEANVGNAGVPELASSCRGKIVDSIALARNDASPPPQKKETP